MEVGQTSALVRQGTDVGIPVELAVLDCLDGVEHRHVHALVHRGDDVVAVGCLGLAAIGVHPDDVGLATGGLDGLQSTVARIAGNRQDDVGALVEQGLCRGLATSHVLERIGLRHELAVLGLGIPAEDLDVLALLLVVVVDALGEAVHEDRHGRDLHATEGADLAGLGEGGCQVARLEGGLGSVEDEWLEVAGSTLGLVVDDGELDVRVLLGSSDGGLVEQESDRDDEITLGVDEGLDVDGVVLVALGLHLGDLHTEFLLGTLQARQGGLVEGLVGETGGVGDHAGLDVGLGRRTGVG